MEAAQLPRAALAGLPAPAVRRSRFRRHGHAQLKLQAISPQSERVSVFAPATIANLGPGFDFLGVAVEGQGDYVCARPLVGRPGTVIIEGIHGDEGRLSLLPEDNCIGVAAMEALKAMPAVETGVSLFLKKGMPLGSGLGSSAASAAAAVWAVNTLFGCPLSKEELVPAGLASEAMVSGYHADNVAPAILGDFVLVRRCIRGEPLELQQISYGADDLWFVLVTPAFEAPTRKMRAALPKQVPFSAMVHNASAGGALVASILLGDARGLGDALGSDAVVEPARGPLIPGFASVKRAAKESGAYGCTISGAGPTCVAVVDSLAVGKKVAESMCGAFQSSGNLGIQRAAVVKLNKTGARVQEEGAGFDGKAHMLVQGSWLPC